MSAVETKPFVTYGGAEGVRVDVFNESRPYGYSNLFQVRLRVVARFPGGEEPYERTLERLGVSDDQLGAVRAEMLESFQEIALPYLLRADFPERLLDRRRRERRKVVPFPSPA